MLTILSYRGPGRVSSKDTTVDIEIDRRDRRDNQVDLSVDRRTYDSEPQVETQLDLTEREYRRRVSDPTYDVEYSRVRSDNKDITVEKTVTDTKDIPRKRDMGYYDDEGNYHSFRRGLERAADKVMHPFHHDHHHHGDRDESTTVTERHGGTRESTRETVRFVESRRGHPAGTVTIPCHFIRIGDLLVLQGRPCQVIRITTSSQTGQYRYLGVDLFTQQLHEESSFVSNPSPSVIVQSMLGPVYKQYRILDIREDGRLVTMTETGDVKQGISVIDQGGLFSKIDRAFADGRGSVRALVINDGGRELVVDYKVIHGSRL